MAQTITRPDAGQAADKTAIRPFKVATVPKTELEELRRRIDATRFPDRETVKGRIRHHYFGEGRYAEAERAPQELLRESGTRLADESRFIGLRGMTRRACRLLVSSPLSNTSLPMRYYRCVR